MEQQQQQRRDRYGRWMRSHGPNGPRTITPSRTPSTQASLSPLPAGRRHRRGNRGLESSSEDVASPRRSRSEERRRRSRSRERRDRSRSRSRERRGRSRSRSQERRGRSRSRSRPRRRHRSRSRSRSRPRRRSHDRSRRHYRSRSRSPRRHSRERRRREPSRSPTPRRRRRPTPTPPPAAARATSPVPSVAPTTATLKTNVFWEDGTTNLADLSADQLEELRVAKRALSKAISEFRPALMAFQHDLAQSKACIPEMRTLTVVKASASFIIMQRLGDMMNRKQASLIEATSEAGVELTETSYQRFGDLNASLSKAQIDQDYMEEKHLPPNLQRTKSHDFWTPSEGPKEKKQEEVQPIPVLPHSGNASVASSYQPITNVLYTDVSYTPMRDKITYGGAIEEYELFRDQWQAADDQMDLLHKPDSQRLVYLRQCLYGRAKSIVDNLPNTSAGYKQAKIMLQKACHDTFTSLFSTLENINKVPKATLDSPTGLDTTYNTIVKLQNLSELFSIKEENISDLLKIQLVEKNLDEKLKKKWREYITNKCGGVMDMDKISLSDMLAFVERRRNTTDRSKAGFDHEVQGTSGRGNRGRGGQRGRTTGRGKGGRRGNYPQRVETTATNFQAQANVLPPSNAPSTSTAASTAVTSKKSGKHPQASKPQNKTQHKDQKSQKTTVSGCAFCSGLHATRHCPKPLTDAKKVFELMMKRSLCKKCLEPYRKDRHSCPSNVESCKECNEDHHTLLHRQGNNNQKQRR